MSNKYRDLEITVKSHSTSFESDIKIDWVWFPISVL